ncbi:MAG: hypothetical protein EOP84_37255, partial [Verrucomicrobiaceae bacterium]
MFRSLFIAAVVGLISLSSHATPIAQPDVITMHHGQKARIAVLANDSGLGATVTVTAIRAPQFGSAIPDPSGQILYTHSNGAPTSDTFRYRVLSDGEISEAEVTVHFADHLRLASSGFAMPQTPPPTPYQFTPAFGGLTFYLATAMATPPGDTRRLFVCELPGHIQLIDDVTAPNPQKSVFLDLPAIMATRSGEVVDLGQYAENGLLGLAFHPNHAQNG